MADWLLICNYNYFDIKTAFSVQDHITWPQINNVKKGDTVYCYVTSPVKSILFKCEVNEIDLHRMDDDTTQYVKHASFYESKQTYMRLFLKEAYPEELYSDSVMRSNGVRSVQVTTLMPEEFAKYILKHSKKKIGVKIPLMIGSVAVLIGLGVFAFNGLNKPKQEMTTPQSDNTQIAQETTAPKEKAESLIKEEKAESAPEEEKQKETSVKAEEKKEIAQVDANEKDIQLTISIPAAFASGGNPYLTDALEQFAQKANSSGKKITIKIEQSDADETDYIFSDNSNGVKLLRLEDMRPVYQDDNWCTQYDEEPFYWGTPEEMCRTLDDGTSNIWNDIYEGTGQMPIGYIYNGHFLYVSNDNSGPEGKHIRVPSTMHMMNVVDNLAGNAVPLAFSELYMALQVGVVDATVINPVNMESAHLDEVAANYIKTPVVYEVYYPCIDGSIWKDMSTDQQEVIQSCMSDALKTANNKYLEEVNGAVTKMNLSEIQ